MEVSQGPNVGCSAKGKKWEIGKFVSEVNYLSIWMYSFTILDLGTRWR
jgi:hypothetical protein